MKRQGILAGLLLLVFFAASVIPPGSSAQVGFPDLIVTDVWPDGDSVCYQMQNIGPEVAQSGFEVALYVDPVPPTPTPTTSHQIDVPVGPGERLNRCFDIGWSCTGFKDVIEVLADSGGQVVEEDDTNNKGSEIWMCDDAPPQITAGPTVASITEGSARVWWITNEATWGSVRFGTRPGVYTGEQEVDSWTTNQEVELTGLQPGTTYHFVVEATDSTEVNVITSSPGYFRTVSPIDEEPPEISGPVATGDWLPMQFSAPATDNVQVHRVEFFLDGQLMGMDYSAPFNAVLDPNYMDFDPNTFYDNHILDVYAYDDNDNKDLVTVDWNADFLTRCGSSFDSLEILEPYEGYSLFTSTSVAPSQIMTIEVEAKEFSGYTMGPCMPLGPCTYRERWAPITAIQFTMDGVSIAPAYVGPHPEDEFVQVYTHDPVGLILGPHRLRARGVASDNCPIVDSVGIRVVGPPDLEVDRTVTRLGNYFQVDVQVTNVGDGPARMISVADTLVGFQATLPSTSSRTASIGYQPDERQTTVTFTTADPHSLPLEPGESQTYQYLAVPVLYAGVDDVQIGGSGLLEYADVGGHRYTQDILLTSEWVEGSGGDPRARLDDAVAAALVASDYLLVTNPFNLSILYSRTDVHRLLKKMAELAVLRNGVLGYYNGYHVIKSSYSAGDPVTIARHLYGSGTDAEVLVGDLAEDQLRGYRRARELTEGLYQLPIARDLHSGDVLAAADVMDTSRAPFMSYKEEILVADRDTGQPQLYQVDCDLVDGSPSTCDVYQWALDSISFDAGDAFAAGNVDPASTRPDAAEILLANDGGTIDVYDLDFLLGSFPTVFQSGDLLAVGEVLGDAVGEETVIGDVSANRVFIYSDLPNGFGQLYSIDSVELDADDDLAVGDVTGDDVEEIVIADKSADRIKVYGFRSGIGFVSLSDWSFALQPEDRMLVGNLSTVGKDEIIVARGRSSGTHAAGDIEILHYTPDGPPGDRAALDALLNPGGAWADAMATCGGTTDLWTHAGHLLIVGETPIIPAFTAYWDLPFTDDGRVEYMDRDYANSAGNANRPEISLGRIIGNNVDRLLEPIQTSIDILLGDKSFDLSHAYLVSSYGEGASGGSDDIDFVDARNRIQEKVDDHFSSILEQHIPSEWDFFHNSEGQDAIVLCGHGSPTAWDYIDTDDIDTNFRPGLFGPLLFGASCSTGRYQDYYSVAEAFLNNGASSYVGATAVAFHPYYRLIAQDFFARVDTTHTLGSALKDAKRHRMLQDGAFAHVFNPYTCASFQLFGDPKLAPGSSSVQAEGEEPADLPLRVEAPAGTMTLNVTVPDYEITQLEGMDYAEIPGGDLVLIVGQPQVPSFPVLHTLPVGVQVQNVTLSGKSEPAIVTGLQIPDVTLAVVAEGAAPDGVVPYEEETWWPDLDFEWTSLEGPGDATTLALTLYPFQTYTVTGNVRFSKEYSFTVEFTTPAIQITATHLAQQAYDPGETVVAEVALESTLTEPEDVIVETTVWSETAGEVAESLPLRTLLGMQGWATFSVEWDSSGFAPGDYRLDIAVRSSDGELLDRALLYFSLGISAGAITSLTATPDLFNPGDSIALSMTFENVGTVPISGTAFLHIQDEEGATVATYEGTIADLSAGLSHVLDRTWDTSAALPGTYTVAGYVTYGGQMAGPASVTVRTKARIYLPLVFRDTAAH